MKKGEIIDRTGEKWVTNEGYTIEIIEYFNSKNCTIQFEDGTIIKNINHSNIKKGNVSNPYHKSVLGVGYFGVGSYKAKIDKKHTNNYLVWRSMLVRCYDKGYHKRKPTYKGCTVNERWHNFQIFAEWCENNFKKGFELDKDVLCKDCKNYSPETCCFLPSEVNIIFAKSNSTRGKYPIGVGELRGKFQANIRINGKQVYLGLFDTPEEAFQAYKVAKEAHIKEVADKWKDQITEKVYQALIKYQIEITD